MLSCRGEPVVPSSRVCLNMNSVEFVSKPEERLAIDVKRLCILGLLCQQWRLSNVC